MDFGIDLLQFVKAPLVLCTIALLQLVKSQLAKRKIVFKNEDNWLWIVLGLGLPLAIIAQGIDGFENLNAWAFASTMLVYPAVCAFVYKGYKIVRKNGKEETESAGDV